MEDNKRQKIIKIYKRRGLKSLVAAALLVVIKKFADKYRAIKEKRMVESLVENKKTILTNVNGYRMILDGEKSGIHHELILNRIREPLATAEMKHNIKSGEIILEAGANIGYYALLESQIVGKKGKIYAIEPARDNFKYLLANIKENKFTNIFPSKLALGDKNGNVTLNIYESENWNTVVDIPYAQKKSQEKIRLQKLDSFLRDKQKPDFIRMDVEGYEYEIFRGMENLLKNNPPRGLFVETHFYIMGEEKSIDFLENLKRKGYEVSKYFLDKKPTPHIFLLDVLIEKLEQIKDGLPVASGEVRGVTMDDLIKNKFNLRGGAPEIFFELKNAKK
jgi:FkbM family methyltransferase